MNTTKQQETISKLNEQFSNIVFDAESHTYSVNSNKYVSVTKYISQFVPPFDKWYYSSKKATELNITQEEVLEMWKANSRQAINKGVLFHSSVENYIKYNKTPLESDLDQYNLIGCWEMMKYLLDTHPVKLSEVILYSEDKRLAGTADLLFINEDGSISILDMKTNTEISTSGYGKNLHYPLIHLDASKMNEYYLQLNMYKFLLEKKGFVVKDMTILHTNALTGFINNYNVPNMQEDVLKILQHRNF